MKYIIWYRRYSDLDHTLPIANLLLDSGISYKNIEITDLDIDKSAINIKNDKKVIHLKKKKIKINQNIFSSHFIKFREFLINYNNSIYTKLFVFLTLKFIDFLKDTIFKAKIVFYSFRHNGNAKFICDTGSLPIYIFLSKISRKNRINLAAVPHGLWLHRGFKDQKLNELVFGGEGDYFSHFSEIILNDKLSSSFHSNKNKIKILGSVRYSKKWLIQLNKIYKPANVYKYENKVKVLLMLEKKGENSSDKFIPYYDYSGLIKTIEVLHEQKNIELIIKLHPSSYKTNYPELKKYRLLDVTDKFETFELIKSSDIVLTLVTTAVIDALMLNKKIAILNYLTMFKPVVVEYFVEMNIESLKDLTSFINSQNERDLNLFEKNFEKFYKEFISDNSVSVEKRYFEYLRGI